MLHLPGLGYNPAWDRVVMDTHKKHFAKRRRMALMCAFIVILVGCKTAVDAQVSPPVIIHTVVATSTMAPTPTGAAQSVLPTETPLPNIIVSASTPTPTTESNVVCPNLSGHFEQHTFKSEAMGEQVRYLVYVPPCYDQFADRAYPTLYLFHGWPLDEYHWQDLGIGLWIDDWISRALIGPMLVVLPGVEQNGLYVNSSGGPNSFEGMITDELVPRIDGAYRTWREPQGRAVGGISRGAVWALEIALRHQDLFGSVGVHSPALALNNPLPQYDPYRLIDEEVPSLRFYISAGDADWARGGAIGFRDQLQARELPVTYQVHAGAHVDDLWTVGMPDYLSWYGEIWPDAYGDLPVWQGSPAGSE